MRLVSASQAAAVAAKAAVTSRSVMPWNPATPSSRWWSLRMATALGPAARARRRAASASPGDSWMV
jgi:hypothetical protein